jgi:hypothetical protein
MITDLTRDGLIFVLEHLRPADRREVEATVWLGSVEKTAARIASVPMLAFEARLASGEPAVVGGIVPIWTGLCSCWAFGTEAWPLIGREVTRFAVKSVLPQLDEAGVRRVECRPMCANGLAVRWLEVIGFQREAQVKAFGQGGEDFYLFARTVTQNGRSTTHEDAARQN